MRNVSLSLAPSIRKAAWWPSGASYAADLRGWRFMAGGSSVPPATAMTFGRASERRARDAAGKWIAFPPDIPAITDLGLSLEPARTNAVRNNVGVGVAAGTPGTLPDYWTRYVGGGLTPAIGPSGLQDGLPYVDMILSGTTNASNGTQIAFDGPTGIAATAGQTWAVSMFLGLPAGTLANISYLRINIVEADASGNTLATLYGPNIRDDLAAAPRRFDNVQVLGQANTAYVRPIIEIAYGNGLPIAFTLRIAGGQAEIGAAPTSPILTHGAAASRAADALVLTGTGTGDVLVSTQAASDIAIGATSGTFPVPPSASPLLSALVLPG